MHYETGLLVLMFVVLALIIGTALRHLFKGTQIPYTVSLLVVGLSLGLLKRYGFFSEHFDVLDQMLTLISTINPHLILFLFLPPLIFESAFSLEVHLFRRIFTQIALLAVPGLIVATLLTAALAKWAFPWEWSWALCLMFGALISATDPVAVVALLKEVSSRKRLETLIEGESLLNDGAAIVFFVLFYGWVVSPDMSDIDLLGIVGDFSWVVSIGFLIGVVLGVITIVWIGRVFNDPMIEITLSIAIAYLVFIAAESIHVSGVVAVVTLALMFAGRGRTRISPEVAGFLHSFWEMMAYIANTLIFLIVGVLIAARIELFDMEIWLALGVLYVGIQLIRAFSVTLFMPVLKRIGIGITREKAIVLVWGGLRGAVSLALALTVAQDTLIPKAVGDQVLALCAGVVVLTILVNGTSMGWVLKVLKLDGLPPAKQATVNKVEAKICQEISAMLPSMMENEFLKGANWDEVKAAAGVRDATEVMQTDTASDEELSVAFKRRLLETERKHYWAQFELGTLGKRATSKLVEAVEHALDGDPIIAPRSSLDKLWQTPPLINALRKVPALKKLAVYLSFTRLTLNYDVARGFLQAQDELESHIAGLAPNEMEAAVVRALVSQNRATTLEYIAHLRDSFPEIIHALETHSAIRLLLNRERVVINQQLKQAVLDTPEAKRMTMNVESKMAQLQKLKSITVPTPSNELIDQLPWSKALDKRTKEQLNHLMEHSIYNDNESIARQGKALCALGIIVRGSVSVEQQQAEQKIKKVLGPGETLGAMSLLSGISPCDMTAIALVNVLWLQGDKLKPLMAQDPGLTEAIGKLLN